MARQRDDWLTASCRAGNTINRRNEMGQHAVRSTLPSKWFLFVFCSPRHSINHWASNCPCCFSCAPGCPPADPFFVSTCFVCLINFHPLILNCANFCAAKSLLCPQSIVCKLPTCAGEEPDVGGFMTFIVCAFTTLIWGASGIPLPDYARFVYSRWGPRPSPN